MGQPGKAPRAVGEVAALEFGGTELEEAELGLARLRFDLLRALRGNSDLPMPFVRRIENDLVATAKTLNVPIPKPAITLYATAPHRKKAAAAHVRVQGGTAGKHRQLTKARKHKKGSSRGKALAKASRKK